MLNWKPLVAFGIAGAILLMFVLVFGVLEGQVYDLANSGQVPVSNNTLNNLSTIAGNVWTGLTVLGVLFIIVPLAFLIRGVVGSLTEAGAQ